MSSSLVDFIPPIDNGFIDIDGDTVRERIDNILKRYCRDFFIVIWIRPEKQRFFVLRRLKPSYCPICLVFHDKIDQHFYYWKGTISLECWRNSDYTRVEHLFIGRYQFKVPEIKKIEQTIPVNPINNLNMKNWIVHDETVQWVQKFNFDHNLVVCAHLGKGKTQQLDIFIGEHPDSSFVILSPRRLFATTICERFREHGFLSYLGLRPDYLQTCKG